MALVACYTWVSSEVRNSMIWCCKMIDPHNFANFSCFHSFPFFNFWNFPTLMTTVVLHFVGLFYQNCFHYWKHQLFNSLFFKWCNIAGIADVKRALDCFWCKQLCYKGLSLTAMIITSWYLTSASCYNYSKVIGYKIVLFDHSTYSYRSKLFTITLSGVTRMRMGFLLIVVPFKVLPHVVSGSFSLLQLLQACSLGILL